MTRNYSYVALAVAVTLGSVIGFALTTAGAAIAIREASDAREAANAALVEVMDIAAKDVTEARTEVSELRAELDRKRPKKTGDSR